MLIRNTAPAIFVHVQPTRFKEPSFVTALTSRLRSFSSVALGVCAFLDTHKVQQKTVICAVSSTNVFCSYSQLLPATEVSKSRHELLEKA